MRRDRGPRAATNAPDHERQAGTLRPPGDAEPTESQAARQRRLPRQQQVDLIPFVVDRLLDPPFEVLLPPGRVGIARDAVLVVVVDRQLLELPTRAGRGRLA